MVAKKSSFHDEASPTCMIDTVDKFKKIYFNTGPVSSNILTLMLTKHISQFS